MGGTGGVQGGDKNKGTLVRVAAMRLEKIWRVQRKQRHQTRSSVFLKLCDAVGLKPDPTEVSEDFARTILVGITFLGDQTELIPCYLLDETCGPHIKDLHVTSLKYKLTQQRKLCNFFLNHDKPRQFILFVRLQACLTSLVPYAF